MAKTIYAAKITKSDKGVTSVNPIFSFKSHDPAILADDADEREERGESAFIPNPDYVEGSGMELANSNAAFLFEKLGFQVNSSEHADLEIGAVQKAALKALNSPFADHTQGATTSSGDGRMTMVDCGHRPGQIRSYLTRLTEIVIEGRARGATHIVVV